MTVMISLLIYLLVLLLGGGALAAGPLLWGGPTWWTGHAAFFACAGVGLIGGCVYCMRAIYLNRCVKGRFDPNWTVWYVIRPLVSLLTGSISYIFLQAGLLILDAASKPETVPYGYVAFAFIAGYNVDNFLKKLEDIAATAWGIDASRTSTGKPPSDQSGS